MLLRKYLFGLIFGLIHFVFAQSPGYLVIISDNGQPVRVDINGVGVNIKPVPELKIGPLRGGYYRVSVYFRFGNIDKKISEELYVPPSSEIVYHVVPYLQGGNGKRFIVADIYPAGSVNTYGSVPLYAVDLIMPTGPQPVYTGSVGCSVPVSRQRFKSMLEAIENESFDDGRLRVAKTVIRTNACLTAVQLRQMMNLFSFDENKVELAKFAWDYLYDLSNFHLIYDTLDFESSKEELEQYIGERSY